MRVLVCCEAITVGKGVQGGNKVGVRVCGL